MPLDERADSVHWADAGGNLCSIALSLTSARIELGFTIVARLGTTQHQVAFGVQPPALPYYFVEHNEQEGAFQELGISSFDGTMYTKLDEVPTTGVHPGTGFLQVDAIVSLSPEWHVRGGYAGEVYTAQAATPGYVGGSGIQVSLNGVDVELTYVEIVSSLSP
jgi:hypothetical protein